MSHSRTAFIRISNSVHAGKCDAASVPLTKVGETDVVAYLGSAWGDWSPAGIPKKYIYSGGDVDGWLASLGFERNVSPPPVGGVPPQDESNTMGGK